MQLAAIIYGTRICYYAFIFKKEKEKKKVFLSIPFFFSFFNLASVLKSDEMVDDTSMS